MNTEYGDVKIHINISIILERYGTFINVRTRPIFK